jgi:hypothetical protein
MVQTKISIVVFILQVVASAIAPVAALPFPADDGGAITPVTAITPVRVASPSPGPPSGLPADVDGQQFRNSLVSQIEGIRGLDPG